MSILSPTQLIDADRVARSTRLSPGDVTKATPVRVLGDSKFAQNDEPDTAPLSHKARMRRFEEIRADLRKVGIRTESELLQMLQCVHANTGPFAIDRKAELLELCCDLENDINAPPPDPEILEYGSGRERGELDSRTVGVKGRA